MSNVYYNVILVFAFGSPSELAANRLLTFKSLSKSKIGEIPIFTQKDIADNINDIFCGNIFPGNLNLFIVENILNKEYVSTLDIIKGFIDLAKEKKWNGVKIIAEHHHIHRCIRDLKQIMKEKEYFLTLFYNTNDVNYYNKNSTQWWTRSRWQWWLREIPLMLLPWQLYKRIAF